MLAHHINPSLFIKHIFIKIYNSLGAVRKWLMEWVFSSGHTSYFCTRPDMVKLGRNGWWWDGTDIMLLAISLWSSFSVQWSTEYRCK